MAAENIVEPTTSTTLSLPSFAATTATTPDYGVDPQIPAPVSASDDPDRGDPDSTREPKRRRYCPKALEKVEELLIAPHNSNPNFSFTFDTKSAASSPEITPKFGSFNFVASNSHENLKQEEEKAEAKQEQSEINGTEPKADSSIEAFEETKQDHKNVVS